MSDLRTIAEHIAAGRFYVEARVGSNNYRNHANDTPCRLLYDGARGNEPADVILKRLADAYLSPPAPGPGFDAEGFVRKCREGAYDRSGEWFFDSLEEGLVAELRAALGTGAGDDGEPVTEEWLRSVGFEDNVLRLTVTISTRRRSSRR